LAPDAAQVLVERASLALWEPGGAAALAELHGRGLRDETIQAAGIGWCPRADGVPWKPPCVVIPWYERGRLTLIKLRLIDDWRMGFPEARRPPKYLEAHRNSPGLYIAAPIQSGKPVIVAEGELDAALIAQEVGAAAGVVTEGSASGPLLPSIVSMLVAAPRWYIATDADRAGDEAAAAWAALAPGRCTRIRPDGPKDWCDLSRSRPGQIRRIFGPLLEGPEATWSRLERQRWGPASVDADEAATEEDEPSGILAGS
jgi:hypothetical protein